MISIQEIEKTLQERLEAVSINIQDDSANHFGHQPGDPAYLTIEVVSPLFKGKSLVQQHKMVYDSLREELRGQIHALSLKTRAC